MFSKLDKYWQHPALYWPLLILFAAATPFAFAPYYHFWLMPLIFGAFVRLIELRPRFAASSAYLFGLTAYTAQFYWIHTALHDVSGLPDLYAVPLTFLLPAYLALYPALCFWLWKKFTLPQGIKTGLVLPILWTLTEFARERFLTGFGWGAIGYSQITPDSPLAGFAPLGGIHMVTLATAFLGVWLVLAIDNTARSGKRLLPAILIAALLAAGYTAQQPDF
ncbi:apolipoprotein N-acyltransferase, partial [Neisseria gonorrhoeae]